MHIQLITKADSQMTGLRRYQDTLYNKLVQTDVSIHKNIPRQPLPVSITNLGLRFGWDLATFFQSYPLWGKYRPSDVYHLSSESLATLLLFNHLRPSVVTVHGLLPYILRNDPTRNLYGNKIHRWFDWLSVRGLRHADCIIAVSNFLKDQLITHVGVAEERIKVIHEAVDLELFKPLKAPKEFLEKFGVDKQYRYILYVGSEQPEKNFLSLIKAFAQLSRHHKNIRLLKVGQPEFQGERDKAYALIKQLDIQDKVVFLGHLGNELPLIYNASDLFVFPSRFEGFGFPPLEAMACGLPVVCSNAGALPEVVGEAALLFDPLDQACLIDAMNSFLVNDGLRKDYIARGFNNVRQFSWETTTKRTIEVYQQLISPTR
jgi:glycosyltransferase involved in cell wall biosynthesis